MKIQIGNRFVKWLKSNEGRFRRRPHLRRDFGDEGLLEFGFEGVDPGIRLVVSDRGRFELWFVREKMAMDILMDLDVRPRYSRTKGHYCADCEEWRPGKYYRSQDELLASHCFERLLEWANRSLTARHRIVADLFHQKADRPAACSVRIMKASEVRQPRGAMRGWSWKTLPVVVK